MGEVDVNGLREGMIFGTGNPLLDISVVTDSDDILKRYGLKENDAILASEVHMPLYKELMQFSNVEYIAGGSTQNALRVAQWILQKPKVATAVGCVGQDEFSKILREKVTGDGVTALYQYTEARPTGTCAVIVTQNGGHRSLCANLSAAECFSVDHLKAPEVNKALNQAEYYYSSGFFITVSIETILEVAQLANKRDKIFMMNLSAPFIPKFFKDKLLKALPYVDILFGNEGEAESFSKEHEMGTDDLREVAKIIAAMPKQNPNRERTVIITQGAGTVITVRDGKLKEYPVPPIPAEKIVDTNGAGDAFVGGFMAQLVRGRDFDECIRCAIWAASEIIQRSGCTFSGPPSYKD